jgi:hypothetical protein
MDDGMGCVDAGVNGVMRRLNTAIRKTLLYSLPGSSQEGDEDLDDETRSDGHYLALLSY